jgi:hypothetical protein
LWTYPLPALHNINGSCQETILVRIKASISKITLRILGYFLVLLLVQYARRLSLPEIEINAKSLANNVEIVECERNIDLLVAHVSETQVVIVSKNSFEILETVAVL